MPHLRPGGQDGLEVTMAKKKKAGPETGKRCDVEDCAANVGGTCAFGQIDLDSEEIEPDDTMHCPE